MGVARFGILHSAIPFFWFLLLSVASFLQRWSIWRFSTHQMNED
jgi:hypothetical protein